MTTAEKVTARLMENDCLLSMSDDLSAMLAIEYARQGKTSETYEEWQLANAGRVRVTPDDRRTRFVSVQQGKCGS